jgi:hypothetical protein
LDSLGWQHGRGWIQPVAEGSDCSDSSAYANQATNSCANFRANADQLANADAASEFLADITD